MTELNTIDYKGKWHYYQDKDIEIVVPWEFVKYVRDSTTFTEEEFMDHCEMCLHYGIPAYVGEDEQLTNWVKKFNNRKDEEYNQKKIRKQYPKKKKD